MTKRSPQQVLDAIDAWDEDDAIDAEMERVLAQTPEERENDLRAAGVDVEAERAKARAWREKATEGELTAVAEEPQRVAIAASPLQAALSPPRVIEGGTAARGARERESRGWWWSRGGMVAAAALAAAVLLVVAWPHSPGVVSRPRPHDNGQQGEPTPRDRADALREKAYAACDRKAWEDCKALLDEAKGLDPGGETDPRVKSSRDAIRGAKGP
jgi:hypothetical protein